MERVRHYCSACNDFHDYVVAGDQVWKHRLEMIMEKNGERADDIVAQAPSDLGDYENLFVDDMVRFTVWTRDRVYFPYEYDGHLDIHWIPREPCDLRTPQCGFCHA
jgi:hypothetical protein